MVGFDVVGKCTSLESFNSACGEVIIMHGRSPKLRAPITPGVRKVKPVLDHDV